MYIPLNLIEELSQDKFESAWRLKVKLKQLKTKIFGGGTMKIWQMIEKPTKALLMVSRMKKFFISRNHSLNPSSKVTNWILEEIFHFKIFVSVKEKLLVHLLVKLENWLRYWKSKYVITISYHASSRQCYAKWNDSYSVSMKNVLKFFWNLLHNHLRLQQLYDKLSSHLSKLSTKWKKRNVSMNLTPTNLWIVCSKKYQRVTCVEK